MAAARQQFRKDLKARGKNPFVSLSHSINVMPACSSTGVTDTVTGMFQGLESDPSEDECFQKMCWNCAHG
jgi:hypothetical protein